MEKVRQWLRSWRLLSLRTALVTLLALYMITGFFVVPPVVERLIVANVRELTGREVALAKVRCNPFTLSLMVRGFSMPDRPGTTLLAFDELHVNVQASSLLRWAPTLKEVRLENPFVALRRFPDGKINVVELVDEIRRRAPVDAEAAAAEEAGPTGLPRLLLQHILVTGFAVQIEDHARDEPLTLALGPAQFELRDISTLAGGKGVNEFAISLKRGGTMRVDGDVVLEPLGLSGTVAVDQAFLDAPWPILKPYLGFDVTAGRAAGRFRYSVRATDDGFEARLEGLDFDLRGLVLQPRDSEVKVLEVEKLTISDGHFAWPEGNIGAAEVGVNGASAFLWLEPDGSFGWGALVPKDTRTDFVHTYRKVEKALPWTATVGRFEVRDSSAAIEDRTFDEPVRLAATVTNFVLRDVTTAPGGRWSLAASASLPSGGAATLDGAVGTGPLRLDLTVTVRDLGIDPVNPYLARLAPLSLRGGRLEASGTVHLDPRGEGAKTTFTGDLTIHEIDLLETAVGSPLLKWDRVDVHGIEGTHVPPSLRIAEVGIHGAGVEVVVAEDGRVSVNELLAAVDERSKAPRQEQPAASTAGQAQDAGSVETAPGGEAAGKPEIEIGTLALHGCSAAYTDRTLAPPFTFALESIDGTIRAISTSGAAVAKLDVDGAVRSGGGIDVEGEMNVLDPARFTDLTVGARQVELPPVSAMGARYLGHPLERGWIDVALDYDIVASKLTGQNRFVTQDLRLGDKIEGQGITGVPIELGVTLLTDKEGKITLEFPIEGDLSDPEFDLGDAIGSAAKEIVGELAKSPFRLLATLGGGADGEEYGYVEFKAGSADLEPHVEQKLRTIAGGAEQRPEVILRLTGVWDPAADGSALQERALELRLAGRSPESAAASSPGETSTSEASASRTGADQPPATLAQLESLYRESASAEKLEALRAQHATAAAHGGEPPVLDETAYYGELRRALIALQPIDETALRAIAAARAEAIRAFLVDQCGLSAERIVILEPTPVKPADEKWVRLDLDLAV